MPARSSAHPSQIDVSERTLREVVEELAALERPPCSPGERQAAEVIAARFRRAGCRNVVMEDEMAWGPWPPTLTGLGLTGVYAALLVLRKRRLKGSLLALAGLAGFLDEIENGPRFLRKTVRTKKKTVNVVAEAGDPDGDRTLVVLAHHDAAQTGVIFDQTWARSLYERNPQRMGRSKFQVPQWWLGVAPALMTVAAALTRRPSLARKSVGLAALGAGLVADIARNPVVPGANDNLSAVASLLALAEALNDNPPSGVRVLLVSCGAEESFQEGIRGFMGRHALELPPNKVSFLNLDTVGSTDLVMLEGEGPVWMEDYTDPSFRDLVARSARDAGVELERGIRARASTDGVIPSRAGYPTATIISFMPWRMPGNYHQMSDVPENLDYSSVTDAVKLSYAVAATISSGS